MTRPFSAPHPWARPLLYLTATAAPFFINLPLYAAWFRAAHVLGHMPRVSIDDPQRICRHDPIYQYLLRFDGALTVVFVVSAALIFGAVVLFTAEERRTYRLKERDYWCSVLAFLLSTIYIFCSDVSVWWMD